MSPVKIGMVWVVTVFLALGQQTSPPSAAAKKPAAAVAASPVTNIVKLLKSGMSEGLIIRTLQKQKPYTPSTDEMVALKQAGATDNLIGAIMDPASASAAPAVVAAAPAPIAAPAPVPMAAAPMIATAAPPVAETGGVACAPPAAVSSTPGIKKRRIAVETFDYAAVQTQVTAMFNNNVNIGQGIRAMLGVKMAQSKAVVLLEREKIGTIMKEQDFGATNRVKQGTKAKIGGLTGADAILFGNITIFGRDDTTKKSGLGAVGGAIGGRLGGALANAKRNDKAVVAITLRLVDAESGETIEAAEARGESSRTSTDWAGMAGGWKAGTGGLGAGGGTSMTSSNFAETIIGEATQDAVNKIAAFLDQKVPAIAAKAREIETRVANIDGCTLFISAGDQDGVQAGDRFEVHKIIKDILDPDTKEVIGRQTEKVGELIVSSIQGKSASGAYGGLPLSSTWPKGYSARLVPQ